MEIGDLVRPIDYPKALTAPIGLIVSIERRGVFRDRWLVKVQWLGCEAYDNLVQKRSLKNLEVISESR